MVLAFSNVAKKKKKSHWCLLNCTSCQQNQLVNYSQVYPHASCIPNISDLTSIPLLSEDHKVP